MGSTALLLLCLGCTIGCTGSLSDPPERKAAGHFSGERPIAISKEFLPKWKTSPSATPRLAGMITVDQCETQFCPNPGYAAIAEDRLETPGKYYWSFPSKDEGLTLLPPVEALSVEAKESEVEKPAEEPSSLGMLLAPQAIAESTETPDQPPMPPVENFTVIEPEALEEADVEKPVTERVSLPEISAEERRLLEIVLHDTSPASTGVLTDQRTNELAKAKIQQAFALSNRGAYYAARQEVIEVMRMISQAKDAQIGHPQRTLALSAGLRALDEASDFAPRGTQLEADLAIDIIATSHRTTLAKQVETKGVLPQQMMDCYYRYAQLKLAIAVAGEPAGSMALHTLGKIYSRLGVVEPERHRLAHRRAVAFQQAALLAHNGNHYAAHELAVLLANSGHFTQAHDLLVQVAQSESNPVVYRNLAHIQQQLGYRQEAEENRHEAVRLAQQGHGQPDRVRWVSPETFAQHRRAMPRRNDQQTDHPMIADQYPTVTPTQY